MNTKRERGRRRAPSSFIRALPPALQPGQLLPPPPRGFAVRFGSVELPLLVLGVDRVVEELGVDRTGVVSRVLAVAPRGVAVPRALPLRV